MKNNEIHDEIKQQKLNTFIQTLMSVINKYKESDGKCTNAKLVGFVDSLLHKNNLQLSDSELNNQFYLEAKFVIEKIIKDEDIYAQIYDYSMDYPKGAAKSLAEVSYKDLRSGSIVINGAKVTTAPLSSYYKARQISNILKEWIECGKFLLGEPQQILPTPKV